MDPNKTKQAPRAPFEMGQGPTTNERTKTIDNRHRKKRVSIQSLFFGTTTAQGRIESHHITSRFITAHCIVDRVPITHTHTLLDGCKHAHEVFRAELLIDGDGDVGKKRKGILR
jgi:hypothetical protein